MTTKAFASVALLLLVGACSSTARGTPTKSTSGGEDQGTQGAIPSDGTSSGSASGSEWESLFEAPASTTATPDSLFGRWSGHAGTNDDLRLVLTASTITQARHCAAFGSTPATTIGASAKARVTSDSIATLETKAIGSFPCDVTIHSNQLVACNFDTGVMNNCFELSGTTLRLYQDGDGMSDYTKLSDE